MAFFDHEGAKIAFRTFGSGPRATVLLPGLLLSQKMQWPLARALADRGHRVVTMDPLGHGRSDRPRDMTRYSMTLFGEQVVGLLDHLELDQAVIGGTSLGANITLEAAVLAPDRVRGMLVEMPVLDNALLGCALAFTPLMLATTVGEKPMQALAAVARRVPRPPGARLPLLAELGLDYAGQEPGPSGAVLQGLFFGRVAPHRDIRRTLEAPALIIGHPRDPIHPFSDADALAHELPHARLLNANSLWELRVSPERLTREIADWVDDCWASDDPRAAAGGARASA